MKKKLQWSKVNWGTLIVSLLALVNGALVSLGGYHLDSTQLNHVDQGVSLVLSLFGIVYPHGMTATNAPATSPQAPRPPTAPPVISDTGPATGHKQ